MGDLGEGVELTPWIHLKPFTRLAALHSDNVRLVPNSRTNADVVFYTSLGADLEAEGLNKKLELGYAVTSQNYLRIDRLDAFEHRTRLRGELSAGSFSTSLGGHLDHLSTPVDPRQSGQVRRLTSGGDLTTDWQPNELLGIRVVGRAEHIDFQRTSLDHFDQLGWGVNGFATVAPVKPVKLLFGGGYRELIYTNRVATAPNYALVNASLGVEVDLFAKLRASAFAGYEYGFITRLRQNPASTPTPRGSVVSGQLIWTPPLNDLHKTTISLYVQQRAFFASEAAFQDVTQVRISAKQALPADLSASVTASYEQQRPRGGPGLNLQSLTTLVGLTWSPSDLLAIEAQARYVTSRTRRSTVEVFEFGLGLTLTY